MCNCIETVGNLIREKTGDPEAWISVSFSIGNEMELKQEKPNGMIAYYREKKKDGTFKNQDSKIGIQPTFCPFCGVRYDPEQKTKEPTNVKPV